MKDAWVHLASPFISCTAENSEAYLVVTYPFRQAQLDEQIHRINATLPTKDTIAIGIQPRPGEREVREEFDYFPK